MNRALLLLAAGVLALAGCDASGPTMTTDDSGAVLIMDGGTPPTGDDADTPPPAGGREPGSACNCDSECAGTAANPGACVLGICMTRSATECSAAGSTAECPTGSRCWGIDGVAGGVCWPDCASFTCGGACDSDGSCIPDDSSSCDSTCAEICPESTGGGGDCPPNSHPEGDGCVCDEGFTVNADRTACVPACTADTDCSGGDVCSDGRCVAPPCTAGSCPSGQLCAASGECVIDLGTPPPGPPPSCAAGVGSVPDWRCSGASCSDLVPFDPDMGPGYWDYPLNGETSADQYRSYVRRDVMMLVKYATAMVDCQSGGWSFGNVGQPLGLGDMSEADGSIPGTRDGSPGHPAGTHVNGHDMDIAYYQMSGDNRLRSVCPHTEGGSDVYHCTGAPNDLDPWRTALFLGHLHASPNVRVIGVDGRVGPLVDSALSQLCADGWVSGAACSRHSITWEETDMGRGWFRFHHHHLHVSISG